VGATWRPCFDISKYVSNGVLRTDFMCDGCSGITNHKLWAAELGEESCSTRLMGMETFSVMKDTVQA